MCIRDRVITWFKAPEKEDTEIVSEQDGSGFQLNDLQTMKISDAIAERGHDYYRENRVRYISLDKTRAVSYTHLLFECLGSDSVR